MFRRFVKWFLLKVPFSLLKSSYKERLEELELEEERRQMAIARTADIEMKVFIEKKGGADYVDSLQREIGDDNLALVSSDKRCDPFFPCYSLNRSLKKEG